MKETHSTTILKSKLFVILFLYVFAFFFKGISVSILLGIALWVYAVFKTEFGRLCINVVNLYYIKNIISVWFILCLLAIIYPLIYTTFDFSFAKLILTQGIHLISAIPVFAWLLSKKITIKEVENCFIWIFVAQTFIQIIVYLSPSLGTAILEYNHYDPDMVIGLGSAVRGKALSAATTYHLTMAYGIAFIIYIKQYYYTTINLRTVIIGILLFVGIFFAGRTGFVGCAIAVIGWAFDKKKSFRFTKKVIIKALIYTIILIAGLWLFLAVALPGIMGKINAQVLPYAFEFLYSLDSSGQMETASTNRLKEMWSSDITFLDILLGTGRYTNPDGSFYMHVDPGILRHMLFMGVAGYTLLFIYQFIIFPINKFKGYKIRYYSFLIILFLIIMEFKCINIGVNKFAFSITMLFAFTYLFLPKEISKLSKTTYYENRNACLRNSSGGNQDGTFGERVPKASRGV